MFAVLAFVAFIVAFICHLAGGSVTKFVEDAVLLGFIFLAAAGLWGGYPWHRG